MTVQFEHHTAVAASPWRLPFSWRPIVPLLVLVVGIAASLYVAFQIQRNAEAKDRERFERQVTEQAAAIVTLVRNHVALLRGTAGLFATGPSVSRQTFADYVSRLGLDEFYPGAIGIGFARPVGRHDDAGDVKGSAIVSLERTGGRPGSAAGYDMLVNPELRAAMLRARDQNLRVITGKVALPARIDASRAPGFFVYVPVYANGSLPSSTDERRRRLIGWVFSPFRASDLIRSAMIEHSSGRLELSAAVYDSSVAPEKLLYRSHAPQTENDLGSELRALRRVNLADRTWLIRFEALPTFERSAAHDVAPIALGAGVVMTLLLSAAAWSQVRATTAAERAREQLRDLNMTLERRVAERTVELERAQVALHRINDNLEEEVATRTADLRAAHEEARQFAYIVSHDLRAPLVNITGFTRELEAAQAEITRLYAQVRDTAPDMLTSHVKAAVEVDMPEAISFIRTSAAKMDRLINVILSLSREGWRVLTPEPIDMGALMRNVALSHQHQIDRSGTMLTIGDLPPITSDRVSIEQVFSNLIDNAVKYRATDRPSHVRISGREVGQFAVFEVADSGRGIDPKDHERIFELFRRAGPQDRPGEGIGLAHVRTLVRRLNGTISVTSKPDQGAVFVVTLPKLLIVDSERKT